MVVIFLALAKCLHTDLYEGSDDAQCKFDYKAGASESTEIFEKV